MVTSSTNRILLKKIGRAQRALFGFIILTLTSQLSFSAFAVENGTWVTVEEATIEQSERYTKRRVGYYTFNNVIIADPSQLSDQLRIVITSSSHDVIDAHGTTDNTYPYFDLAEVNDQTQIYFASKRATFAYTAELQQFVIDDVPVAEENLLTVPNMAPSSHWERSVLGNVVEGNDSQEAVATLIGAANSNVYIIFDIEESDNLIFSFNQDETPENQVTFWEAAHRTDSGWVVLNSWSNATTGLNTFTADGNVTANKIRFRFRTTAGSNLGINQLKLISKVPETTPDPDPIPTPDPDSYPEFDTDLTGYTGYTDENGVTTVNVGFFENTVFDDEPKELIAESMFADTVNDTFRLKTALNQSKREVDGGVVILRANPNGQNRFSLSHIAVPSNIRIEVEPGVILEMRGIKEDLYPTSKNEHININKPNRQFLFSFGRSNGPGNLLAERIENVEVRSTIPGEKFTIDATTNMPHNYGYMNGGNGNGVVNLTRAIPVGLFYVKNFAISDINIEDNHTESVAVQMFADADYKDGAFAWRFGSKPIFLENRYVKDNPDGTNKLEGSSNVPLKTDAHANFLNEKDEIIADMFAIKRNPTYGRTPVKGSIKNIKASHSHTGYGVVQVYGGDWIEIDNIEAFNGIGVRLEAGNGTDNDNFNRSGPYLSSMNKINISNVKVTNGFTGVWLKPHAKIMKDITVENIEAIDTGTAILVGKGSFACKTNCRDLTRGRINNLVIKGDISLTQTVFDAPVAEVGNNITYLINDANRQYLANLKGKTVEQLTRGDLQQKTITGEQTPEQLAALTPTDFDNPSGTRWYKIFPTAPILALSMLSETEVGDESAKVGFYPADFSQANISSIGLPENTLILYRGNMRWPDGSSATDFINK